MTLSMDAALGLPGRVYLDQGEVATGMKEKLGLAQSCQGDDSMILTINRPKEV